MHNKTKNKLIANCIQFIEQSFGEEHKNSKPFTTTEIVIIIKWNMIEEMKTGRKACGKSVLCSPTIKLFSTPSTPSTPPHTPSVALCLSCALIFWSHQFAFSLRWQLKTAETLLWKFHDSGTFGLVSRLRFDCGDLWSSCSILCHWWWWWWQYLFCFFCEGTIRIWWMPAVKVSTDNADWYQFEEVIIMVIIIFILYLW